MTTRVPHAGSRMSRRAFLTMLHPGRPRRPVIDPDRCTGCGLCTLECPTASLSISRDVDRGTERILFVKETCTGCAACVASCPEKALQRVEDPSGGAQPRSQVCTLFEDRIVRCTRCGIPLYPRSMADKLSTRTAIPNQGAGVFGLCPVCRIRICFQKGMSVEPGDED